MRLPGLPRAIEDGREVVVRRHVILEIGPFVLRQMRRILSKASPVLKALFGASIFVWMAASGKLNLAEIARSFEHWPALLAIAGIGYFQVAITTWRWRLLLGAQDIRLSYSRAWGLTMIGMLFSTVIPGAVGGDLIKGYYIARAAAGRKAHAATSVLMDRVVGLIGLLLLGAAMVAVNPAQVLRNAATRSLGAITIIAVLGSVGGLYLAVLTGGRLSAWGFLPRVLRNVFSALHEYRRKASVIPITLAISVFNQALSCVSIYLALRSTGAAGLTAGEFFLIVPLGLVTSAVPISPAGVGVGQAAFFALFQMVAPRFASAGTAAFTVFQAVFILLCLTGLFWYVSYRHRDMEGRLQDLTPPQDDPAHLEEKALGRLSSN